MPEHDGDFATTIGQDASFTGKLQFEKGARLLGAFEGEINTKGQLVIANSGKLAGEVHAGSIRVEGQVNGNLNAGGKIHLTESARIEGDIQASKLEVAEGAVLVGRCSIGGRSEAGQPKAAAAPVDKVRPMREGAPGAPVGSPTTAGVSR